MEVQDGKLIVLSNREPYRITEEDGKIHAERTIGGLVTALEPLVRKSNGTWIAWGPGGTDRSLEVPEKPPRFTLRQVPVSDEEKQGYYDGFANGALWPLFHYFIDRCEFELDDYVHYERVNRRFAQCAVEATDDGDLIWVQDYHLLLAPGMIREMREDARVGFFLHIPFPPIEVLQVLPWHREILHGLLGADLVGFHTSDYVDNFLACCEQLLDADVDWKSGQVRSLGRSTEVRAFPIGIDHGCFAELAASAAVQEKAERLRQGFGVENLILGVDRLDYTKGILERLHAIELYFERYPERIGRDTFIQIAVPSRTDVPEYQALKRQIDEAVGRLNGALSSLHWEPVRYIYRSLDREDLTAFYVAADVALVTPLRDGMNLVVKEYCACSDAGVVVLSELAGASHQFGGDALMVNPFDLEAVAAQIHAAIELPMDERRSRMQRLQDNVREEDIFWWLKSFLDAADSPAPGAVKLPSRPVDVRAENSAWQMQ